MKIERLDDVLDSVRLPREAWKRVDAADDRKSAILKELSWPEGFLESLAGKPLEEQMQAYRIVEDEVHSRTAYGEITKENQNRYGYALDQYSGLLSLIVEDGILLGVRIEAFASLDGAVAFPYQTVCTYYASDDNGSGSNDREDNAHLCCVAQ